MPRKIDFVIRLQHWMDSVPGQTFLNYAYSWGASIVILGALFKLTHLPGGNLMLFIGMGTEVVVFFISAFDRPFDKTEVGKVLPPDYQTDEEIAAALDAAERGHAAYMPQPTSQPVLENADEQTEEVSAPKQDEETPDVTPQPQAAQPYVQPATTPMQDGADARMQPSAGGQTIIIQGGGTASAAPVQPTAEIDETHGATDEPLPAAAAMGITIPQNANSQQLAAVIREANDELLRRAQAVLSPEMEAVTKTYIERMRTLTDTLSKVDEQSARLANDNEEMERLSRTLTSINSIYELQLKGASTQIVTIDQINEQTRNLVRQIEELNGVYARMIQALTINAGAAVGAAGKS
ncbi:MAG: gliding motility protein GldL [Bacteroidaceae bacterium]|nr:gliding motility protein GldL [Bacteroidaceae bacterium]